MAKRLLTLLHISDLHFGVPTAADGSEPPNFWSYSSQFDGLLGHHGRALKHLHEFLVELRDESPRIVVTGDLTSCGKQAEFQLARTFLEDEINTSYRPVGLRDPAIMERTIPGNHDYWPGARVVWGWPTVGLANTFYGQSRGHVLPMNPFTVQLNQHCKLVIYGLDWDSQVFPAGTRRFFARGRFPKQVTALDDVAGDPVADELRVLLVHHSPAWAHNLALGIEQNSVDRLWQTVEDCGFSVLLTGHVHVPGSRVSITKDGWPVVEARCGTTTQADVIPGKWAVNGTTDPRRFPANSLLVHRLFEDGGHIDWHTDLHWRTKDQGFTKGSPLMSPVTVWPR